MDHSEAREDKQETARHPKRKPYKKPTFRFERVFETQALACGKIHSHGTACKLTPKSS